MAIKAILENIGVRLSVDTYLLNSLTKACKLQNDSIRIRLPIHKQLLHVILNQIIKTYQGQIYLKRLYLALLSTAYYSMFRVGEITKGTHVVLASDVHIGVNKKKILFLLRSSKMHGKHTKPQVVKITATASRQKSLTSSKESDKFCPFAILWNYVNIHKGFTSNQEQFFVFHDRSPVTPQNFNKVLKYTLKSVGIDYRLYSSHCFRGGRSKDLLEMGVSIDVIKKLGRWSHKSTAIYTYLK